MVFTTGADYPHLCKNCQQAITELAQLFEEGHMEDTDNEEAAFDYLYDNRQFCGGSKCVNRPNQAIADELGIHPSELTFVRVGVWRETYKSGREQEYTQTEYPNNPTVEGIWVSMGTRDVKGKRYQVWTNV